MSNVKHVYFDVGGVLLLDFSGTNKWTELKRDLGISEDQDLHFESVWNRHQERICIDCDVDTLVTALKSELDISLPDKYSLLSDFVNRFDHNHSIWPIAVAAKKKYSVGLLTNMYPRMLGEIQAKKLIPDVEWNTIIDSSVVGYQKPEKGIYEIAEKFSNIEDAASIFFIDNSAENVETARSRGWQAFLYDPQNPEDSSRELAELLGLSV